MSLSFFFVCSLYICVTRFLFTNKSVELAVETSAVVPLPTIPHPPPPACKANQRLCVCVCVCVCVLLCSPSSMDTLSDSGSQGLVTVRMCLNGFSILSELWLQSRT